MGNNLARARKNIEYKPMFILSIEGTVTEREYFNLVNQIFKNIIIKFVPRKKSKTNPSGVLSAMKKYISECKDDFYSAWIIQDRDTWPKEQLDSLFVWEHECSKYKIALSNPKFEYWLLLHFEDGCKLKTENNCSERLKKYLSGYSKHINDNIITKQNIQSAINRASCKSKNCNGDIINSFGQTDVYILMNDIIQKNNNYNSGKREC